MGLVVNGMAGKGWRKWGSLQLGGEIRERRFLFQRFGGWAGFVETGREGGGLGGFSEGGL